MTGKVIWTTQTGETLDIKDMTDSHLLNTIQFLKRRIDDFWSVGYPCFQGELAQECAEKEYEQAEELMGEMYDMRNAMKKEARRRGLRLCQAR